MNRTGYADPEVDALIDQIEGQMVTYVRDGLIEKVWRKVLGDARGTAPSASWNTPVASTFGP